MEDTLQLYGTARMVRLTTDAPATAARDAFVEVFERTFERLHRYLYRLTHDADLAEELAQDAFVKLFRRGEPPDDPDAWLFTVATNLFRNAKTKRARRLRLLTEQRSRNVLSDPRPSPREVAEGREDRRRVRAALDGLDERDRALLLLRAEGHSYNEIAEILRLNAASVGTLLRRAKVSLRAALQEAT